jgi:hypothetical protein
VGDGDYLSKDRLYWKINGVSDMHEFWTGVNGSGATLIAMLLAVFIGIWLNNRGLDKLETKFDKLDAKMDAGFASLRSEIHAGFLSVEKSFSEIRVAQAVQEYRLQLMEKSQPTT